jgi:hypothetical protein
MVHRYHSHLFKRRNKMAIKTYKDGTLTGLGRTTAIRQPGLNPIGRRRAPNAFFVLTMSAWGSYPPFGGLVETPVLDSLAANGLR